ncbi:xanthine dehydrogenase family protein molybdopterin-binding subunit [Halobellus ordinarius]|uniref:xanthine dehydrogenase family protein molybdopterin-binding subunit n=1 Tax=Halobellus ordinarius TaxID=3075120 RepID=UPI0028805AAF|nr:xanthine dehydrogenase family protein molybdopterin-binding subunit [Halobellus sp. ZY16]
MSTDEHESLVGSPIERREDLSLLTGRGDYTGDIERNDLTHAAILRSPHANARIEGIETAAAETMDGVSAVFTGRDIADSGIPNNIQTGWKLPDLAEPQQRIMATDTVHYQGEPVAVVVAATPARAVDAAASVEVSYEPLPAAVGPSDAVEDEAPLVHEDVENNLAFDWEIGDEVETEEAFESAEYTASIDLTQQRIIPSPMEPRASLADYDAATGELTLWLTSQNPHLHRTLLATQTLGIPESKVRVIAPEVGGGFGNKIYHYPDEAIVSWCSMQLDRPVKWQATRSEDNHAACHSRAHETHGEIAIAEDGTIVGLRADTFADMGAYLQFFAPAVPTFMYGCLFPGQYGISNVHCRVRGTFTNTAPVDAYRGAGRPEATFLVERLVDLGAREAGIDPVELRRQNYIQPDEFPFDNGVGLTYDSGNYERSLDTALEKIDYGELRETQEQLRKNGRYLGIGIVGYVEACGIGPSRTAGELGSTVGLWESSVVRFNSSGTVTVFCGTSGHGQGHETTFAQIVADELGVDYEDIEIVEGDTEQTPEGRGSYGSRSGPVGGSAVVSSTRKVVEKARKIAAHQFEAAPEDIEFDDGTFSIRGAPSRSVGIQEIAKEAYTGFDLPEEMEPGLEATAFYDPEDYTYPFGTHIALVEVDPESGEIDIERYIAVDDVGNQINPQVVEGQVHGGVAQGIGQALYEAAEYDESGQLRSDSFENYAVPAAEQIPSIETDSTVTPCPHNPLGVKGVGEAGAIASPPAVVNAVVDALEPFGVSHIDMPLTPEAVWTAINESNGGDN